MSKIVARPIPDQYKCDNCGYLFKENEIDASGSIDFVGRDHQGHAVGGFNLKFDLCRLCAKKVKDFFNLSAKPLIR